MAQSISRKVGLVTALRENVPQSLLTAAKNGSMDATTGLLVEKLRKSRGLAPEVCAWAVAAWIEALGLASGARKPLIPAASLPGARKRLGRRRSSGVYWPGVLGMAVTVDLIIVLTSPFLGFTARSMDIVLETAGPVLGLPLLFGFTVSVIYILARLEGRL
ncbi:MAG: hypothetical protein SCM96_15330 [Acidobacteriota bacterium]|nr:hypothetical protein [Acidobacteriota bacterium]